MKAGSHFSANKTDGCGQSFQGAFCFVVVTLYGDENPRGAGIVCQRHAAYGGQTDSGIAKFTLQNSEDFLAQGFAQASPMILGSSALYHFTPE